MSLRTLFFCMLHLPPRSTLFPYTTLFRSFAFILGTEGTKQGTYFVENDATVNKAIAASDPTNPRIDIVVGSEAAIALRSEEHTSELQSLTNLVCRLLLEKKKKTKIEKILL